MTIDPSETMGERECQLHAELWEANEKLTAYLRAWMDCATVMSQFSRGKLTGQELLVHFRAIDRTSTVRVNEIEEAVKTDSKVYEFGPITRKPESPSTA